MPGQIESAMREACDALLVLDASSFALRSAEGTATTGLAHPTADAPLPTKSWLPLATQDELDALHDACRRAIDEGASQHELGVVRLDGTPLWLDLRMRATEIDGSRVVVALGFDVTAHKKREADLRRTRAFLEAAIRQSGIGIVIMQPAGEVTRTLANAAARQILGVPTVDETSDVVSAAEWPTIRMGGVDVPPTEFPVVRAFRYRESITSAEMVVVRKDGDVRTVLCSAGPVIDDQGELQGSIALFPDVTEWKRSEAAAREQGRLLQIFHDQIRDAVYAIDADGRFDYLTPSVERLTRRPKETLLGKTLAESGIVAEASLPQALADLEHVLAGNALTARDYGYVTGWGEDCIGEVTGSPMRDEDDRPRALFVVRDVTARRREAAIRDAREAQTRQGQKLEALGTLAAGFAHEMNNPLTGILNLAELVELGLVKPDGMHDVALRIKSLCERMTSTVRNLLSFAASDSKTTRIVSLVEVVDPTLELAAPRLKREGITCTRRVGSATLPEVEGRPSELQQALLILLMNACDAIRALPAPDPSRKTIEILVDRSARIPDGAAIHVTDHGVGIAEDVAYRVFDPFFTTKPPDQGSGMGLWIARGIVRDHGGMLDLESRAGVGTTFRLELPGASRTEGER